MKPDYCEAVIYKGLLYRVKAQVATQPEGAQGVPGQGRAAAEAGAGAAQGSQAAAAAADMPPRGRRGRSGSAQSQQAQRRLRRADAGKRAAPAGRSALESHRARRQCAAGSLAGSAGTRRWPRVLCARCRSRGGVRRGYSLPVEARQPGESRSSGAGRAPGTAADGLAEARPGGLVDRPD